VGLSFSATAIGSNASTRIGLQLLALRRIVVPECDVRARTGNSASTSTMKRSEQPLTHAHVQRIGWRDKRWSAGRIVIPIENERGDWLPMPAVRSTAPSQNTSCPPGSRRARCCSISAGRWRRIPPAPWCCRGILRLHEGYPSRTRLYGTDGMLPFKGARGSTGRALSPSRHHPRWR